jgi:signal transduction histidine kinase
VVGGLLSDVTDARRAEASLLQAKHAAERSSHARTSFLATVSHEIRSPLGAVRGFAELLAEEVRELEAAGAPFPPQIAEFADVIGENTRRALHLVHRLFDLSRLETGSLALRSVPVELHPAVRRVLERHGDQAAAKGLYVHFQAAEAEPVLVADPERVEEVVDHLVSNAVKFTEEGGVTVTTLVERETVRLIVQDTGVGIDAAFLPGLFEPFSQEDYRLSRAHGGAGLGLAVARRLLDGMGGSLTVESEKGVGSRFEVVFAVD